MLKKYGGRMRQVDRATRKQQARTLMEQNKPRLWMFPRLFQKHCERKMVMPQVITGIEPVYTDLQSAA